MNKKIIQRISLLILLFVLPVAYPVNDVHAQDVRVTIRMDKVRMEQVMNEIERQTKYLFGSADNVDVNRIVTVQVVDRPLREALDAMLRGTNISYMVQGSNIVLKNRRSEADANRPVTVSGIVRDVAGNPVVGAAVVVKGTTIGVCTDIEGRFALQVPPPLRRPFWKSTTWVMNRRTFGSAASRTSTSRSRRTASRFQMCLSSAIHRCARATSRVRWPASSPANSRRRRPSWRRRLQVRLPALKSVRPAELRAKAYRFVCGA